MNRLSRRTLLNWAALSGAPAVLRGRFSLFAESNVEYSARAIQLVGETTVVDLLNQFRFADYSEKPPKSELWLNKPESFTSADAVTYQDSGIKVFSLGHSVPDYQEGLRFFAKWNGFLAAHTDLLLRIDDVRDFDRVRNQRKIGILLTMQDSTHFRGPADVDEFFALGQRFSGAEGWRSFRIRALPHESDGEDRYGCGFVPLRGPDNTGRSGCGNKAGALHPCHLSHPDSGAHARENR